ncbi:MAG: class I SAM-dependent methyltransferase [Candidatus Hodarchaeota archaeon]
MDLLPRKTLLKTGQFDEAHWNYRPLLGFIQRRRFKLVLKLLYENNFDRLLELGYGSGIFMPELAKYCKNLYGIDIHMQHLAVKQSLTRSNISAVLIPANALALPFHDDTFDCVVAVSTLEFIDDINSASVEIKRIIKPNGLLIAVVPGYSPIANFGLRLLTGKKAKECFQNKREQVVPTLTTHFSLKHELNIPAFGGPKFNVYTALKLSKSFN